MSETTEAVLKIIKYCEEQAKLSWRDGMTSDEAFGRNQVAEHVLNTLDELG
jgi:hypothetical protein